MSTKKSEFTTVESTENKYPDYLKSQEQWVCWAGNKQPRAPWRGHAYPVKWNSNLDADEMPTVAHEKAKKWVEMAGPAVHDWPDDISEEDLELGYLLAHEGCEISLIDLDDVRRPDSGDIHPIAQELLSMADSYAEISQSGEGVHIFVMGTLPDRLGKVIEDIDDEPWVGEKNPGVEIYSNSRVVAMTGKKVDGTPETVEDGQEVIDHIVDEFEEREEESVGSLIDKEISSDVDTEGSQSPYYQVEPQSLVNTSGGGWNRSSGSLNGPHPIHGDSDNSNFLCDSDIWHCFSHDSTGGPLKLVAMFEGYVECANAGLDNLSDEEFLELCLTARDDYSQFDEDWKPPYRALLEVAKNKSLVAKDADNLKGMYEYARQVYDRMTVDDI